MLGVCKNGKVKFISRNKTNKEGGYILELLDFKIRCGRTWGRYGIWNGKEIFESESFLKKLNDASCLEQVGCSDCIAVKSC